MEIHAADPSSSFTVLTQHRQPQSRVYQVHAFIVLTSIITGDSRDSQQLTRQHLQIRASHRLMLLIRCHRAGKHDDLFRSLIQTEPGFAAKGGSIRVTAASLQPSPT